MNVDVLIKNGEIIDGSGSGPKPADLAIEGGRIVRVGDVSGVVARETFDTKGKYITPGFIDAHGHSDIGLYLNPKCETKIAQGITTEVMGNCGYSPFPLLANNRGYLLEPKGVECNWSTAGEYFGIVHKQGTAMNAVPQVGHITVRAAVLDNQDRPATPEEIGRMKDLVRAAMQAGACGLSTGLDYHPSTVADLDEIVELAKVVAEFGGFYTSHLRGYSRNVLNAVVEAIEVGRRTGVRVQISHLGVYGRGNWGHGKRMLDIMDGARRDGVRVACDMMPYPTKGSWWSLRAIFPAEHYDWKKPYAENLPGLRAKLRDPATRARLKAEIEIRRERPKYGFHEEFSIFSDWRDILIQELPVGSKYAAFVGRSIADAAKELTVDPCDFYFDRLIEDGENFAAICSPIDRGDFMGLLTDEWTMFGTDAIATSLGRLREPWNTIQPHPRHYGTFPRVLATFVRDERVLGLGDAVRRMTGLVADHFGLSGRGYVREDCHADLVVFDPAAIAERATWRVPSQYPAGIEHVFVNGAPAMKHGEMTGAMGGKILTRN